MPDIIQPKPKIREEIIHNAYVLVYRHKASSQTGTIGVLIWEHALNFDEYQQKAISTDVTASQDASVLSISFMDKVLGLLGESGEIAEKLKKILRDKNAQLDEADRKELLKELGDVLWHTAVLTHYLGESFDTVASNNIAKLADRQKRGVLKGKGDNR